MAYEAIETKILAKESYILDKEKFKKLLACDSVEKIGEIFKNTYNFNDTVDNGKKQTLHREGLEDLFSRYKVAELEEVLHFFSGPYKEFLQTFFMEYEIYDLVLMLRKISKGESAEDIQSHFIHSQNYSSLQYDKLIEAKTVVQFIEKLKGTPYYSVLKTTTDSDFAKREFHAETKLQLLLYNTLFKKAQKLRPLDKQAAENLIGSKIDCFNVQWIYRARKYYRISPEQMLIYSLRRGSRLSFNKLKVMCYAKTVDDIQKLANDYLKYRIFENDSELAMERNIGCYLYSNITNNRFKQTIGIAIAYIYLLEVVMNEFVIVTEAIRYSVPKELMGNYLICSMEKEEVK
jgi:V/A-type H+-transporting ATPase subunit C